jgi:hypothetical protein
MRTTSALRLWRRHQTRVAIWVVAFISVLAGALVNLTDASGRTMQSSPATSPDPAQPAMSLRAWADNVHQVVSRAAGDQGRICSPNPPEYPGCTIAQMNDWEDGDPDAAQAHYRQARWGQKVNFDWSHLGPAHNNHLKELYDEAVHKLKAKAGSPLLQTWGGFKQDTDCSGGFWGAAWSTMCRFTNAIDNAVPGFDRATLVCGGWTLVISGVEGGVLLVLTLVEPEEVAATAISGHVLCTMATIAHNLGVPLPGQKHPGQVRQDARLTARLGIQRG